MSILPFYNGLVFNNVDREGRPHTKLYGRKNLFYVFYCGNKDCLRRIYTTWVCCPYCGEKIDWSKKEKYGGKKI